MVEDILWLGLYWVDSLSLQRILFVVNFKKLLRFSLAIGFMYNLFLDLYNLDFVGLCRNGKKIQVEGFNPLIEEVNGFIWITGFDK